MKNSTFFILCVILGLILGFGVSKCEPEHHKPPVEIPIDTTWRHNDWFVADEMTVTITRAPFVEIDYNRDSSRFELKVWDHNDDYHEYHLHDGGKITQVKYE